MVLEQHTVPQKYRAVLVAEDDCGWWRFASSVRHGERRAAEEPAAAADRRVTPVNCSWFTVQLAPSRRDGPEVTQVTPWHRTAGLSPAGRREACTIVYVSFHEYSSVNSPWAECGRRLL